MRHILLLILISTITKSISQTPILTIDSVPTQGVLLNTHWQYKMDHATDNRWKNIDPNREMLDSLPADIRKGIGTMRLYFMPSSKLKGKGYSMPIQQSIASEYYLNGNKLVSYGHLDTDPKKVVGQDPYWTPIHFPMKYDTINTLEIRFAFPKTKLYTTVFETENPVANLSLYESNHASTFYAKQISNYHVFEGLLIALCIMIMIIHFAFYYFNPEIKANLWFGLSRGIYLIGAILQMIFWFYTIDVSDKYWFGTMAMILFTLNNCTTFYAVLLYLQKKPDSWDKIGMALVIPTAVFVFMTQPWAWRIAPLFQVLIQVFTIRAAYLTLKKNKSDSILIMLGAVATILFFIKFISMGTYSSTSFFISLYPLRMFYYILYLLCLPIIFSILLSKEFSDTSKKLKLKLSEVQSLSAKNILIEQEKQQILQNQNLILEKEVTERTQDLIAKNHELEIEASLDKVRSRSLAMQHSDEIQEVAYTLYAELKKLNFPFGACSVYLIDQDDNMESWVAGFGDGEYPQRLKVPKFDHPVYNAYIEAFRKGKKYDVQFLSPTLKPAYDDQMFLHTDYKKLNPEIIQFMRDLPSSSFSMAYNKYGALHWGPAVLSEVQANILQKFSSVFEQSYTRFLDLQKSETQAREAQIEVALERVRSRTMAMQHSNELGITATLLFKQVIDLGVNAFAIVFQFWQEDGISTICWASGSDGIVQPSFRIPHTIEPFHHQIYNAWKRGDDFFVMETEGKELEAAYHFLIKLMGGKEVIDNIENSGFPIPKFQATHCAFFQQGYIMYNTYEPSPEAHDIFKRFGKVFEQTYTRFLDLQKAEAQAREAKIEAAVERVRAQSMAMHKTSDLTKVNEELLAQLKRLQIDGLTGVAFYLVDPDEIVTVWDLSSPGNMSDPNSSVFTFNAKKYPILGEFVETWKSGIQTYFIMDFPKEKLLLAIEELQEIQPMIADHFRNAIETGTLQHQWNPAGRLTNGILSFDLMQAPTEDIKSIVIKMAGAFNMAYQRFLDLQKAEAQTREAQIQLALERVRAASMAMQHSNQLKEIAATTLQQLQSLGFTYGACSIVIMNADTGNMLWWISGFGNEYPTCYQNIYFEHPFYLAQLNNWKEGKKYAVMVCEGEDKKTYDEFVFSKTEFVKIPEELQKIMKAFTKITFSNAYMKHGALSWSTDPLSDEHASILQRFAAVFEQSYTRFLDLQKAEVQAKEAQIEATLERIRSRALAMNTSDELNTLIGFTYSECLKLNMHLDRGFIMTFDSVTNDANWWMVGSESPDKPSKLLVKYHEHAPNLAILDGWHSREQKWSYFLGGENKKNWDDYTLVKTDLALLPDFVIQDMRSVENIILNASFQNFGCIMLSSFEPMSDEHFDLLVRISKVFDFTYTRFLDLKSKEEQLREAQIETALEKIRSRSLAMHQSDELHEVMKVLFEKMKELNVIKGTLALQLFDEEKNSSDFWVSNEIQHISKVSLPYRKDILESNGYMKDCWKAYLSKVDIINKMYPRDQKDRYFDYVFASNDTATIPTHVREFINNNPDQIQCLLVEKHSCIFVDNWEAQPFEEDQIKILKRVAKVFDQSYIRFLDLQKAEEQTREAQIEASLERIRAATLAMQSTDQLSSVILFIYGELNKIESELDRCFFMVFDPQNFGVTWWMAGVDTPDLGKGFFVPYSEHAPQMAYLKGWQEKKERWQYRMQGDEKIKWDNYLFHHTDLARLPDVIKDNMQAFTDIYLDGSFNSFGCLTTGSPVPLSTKAVDLLVRYSKVFDLSFTRYNDLKQAEAQARESQIETALEKIRSSSLAMQKSHEIKSVVTTLFQKLKELKVDFNGAAAIHIFNDTTKDAVIWVATPTLESTIEVQLPYDADYFTDNPIISDIWHAKETGQDIISKIYPLLEKNRYFQYVFKHNPQIPDFEQKRIYNELNYSATFIAQPNSLLGVNSWSDNQLITDEQYKLLKRVGYVFEQAYVRFLDLQKAEALAEQARLDLIQIQTEKKRAEDALKELSATQAQLIQSEKMASLGELTAGIAHEIQNPLNFVNNFSEINNDLINELKEEFEKGNKQQATDLINDIKINSEKIHHHGHRASSIVKNMLEHSRKSSGVKSLTDINALCNEFLRLAYHGLRGKDKTFNSDFSIDPDLSLPKINVISQDISRVILNLVTNAFYAVCEKSKQINIRDYKPEVTIKTRKIYEEIEIHINDNGPGIPDSIKDKIFQPFFTTKPTGQGTGLGLSLSYDIVKAHGGTIKVASPEGHGSSFVITLPIA